MEESSSQPPVWIVVAVQAVAVIADTLGQKTSRHVFKGSQRKMILGIAVATTVISFAALAVIQASMPQFTGNIYMGEEVQPCYREVDIDGHFLSECNKTIECHPVTCPSQGPLSVWRYIGHHPIILTNGLMNIVYFFSEVLLYLHPLGLIFLVLSSLLSSFLITPFEAIVNIKDKAVPFYIIATGIIGGIFCIVELKMWRVSYWRARLSKKKTQSDSVSKGLLEAEEGAPAPAPAEPPPLHSDRPSLDSAMLAASVSRRDYVKRFFLYLVLPVIGLSVSYALWFIFQKAANDLLRMNAFGYGTVDNGFLIFYLVPFLVLMHFSKPLTGKLFDDDEKSLWSVCREATHDCTESRCKGLLILVVYRTLIIGRAIMYFFLSAWYDLGVVYLELQIVRLVLSWLMSLLCCFIPVLINITEDERRQALYPVNILLKAIGTALIVVTIVMISQTT